MYRLAVCAGLLAVVSAAVAAGRADEPAKTVAVSEVAVTEIDKAVTSAKGKVVVVDFWATWCAPCVKKFPHLVELHKRYRDKGLVCVSVSADKEGPKKAYDKEKVLAFLKEQGATFPNFIVADPDADEKKLLERFGKESGILPYMTVFGKDGKRVWDSEQKKLTDEELVKLIETELAK